MTTFFNGRGNVTPFVADPRLTAGLGKFLPTQRENLSFGSATTGLSKFRGDPLASATCKPQRLKDFALFNPFIREYLPLITPIAKKRQFDPALLLGLIGHESTWGTSHMAQKENNPVGATPRGFNTPGVHYVDPESSLRNWDAQWGPRIQGTGNDAALFIQRLSQDNRNRTDAVDRRGAYNPQNSLKGGDPRWAGGVEGAIQSVRRRLPLEDGC